MRWCLIVLFVLGSMAASGEPLVARGLRAPVFDAAGRLVRRITAAAATGPVERPVVEEGRLEFFGEESETVASAVIEFDRAEYNGIGKHIRGERAVRFVTSSATVAGRGFDCALGESVLTLNSEVRFESERFEVSSERAEILFDPNRKQHEGAIRQATLLGRTVIHRTVTAKAPFDRAETEYARYSADEAKVYLKTPVLAWTRGEKTVIDAASEFIEIDLSEEPDPSTSERSNEPAQTTASRDDG
jgi:hypothetical protein